MSLSLSSETYLYFNRYDKDSFGLKAAVSSFPYHPRCFRLHLEIQGCHTMVGTSNSEISSLSFLTYRIQDTGHCFIWPE